MPNKETMIKPNIHIDDLYEFTFNNHQGANQLFQKILMIYINLLTCKSEIFSNRTCYYPTHNVQHY